MLSTNGRHLIQLFEELRLGVYQGAADKPGDLTVGFGHLLSKDTDLRVGDQITNMKAEELFDLDIQHVVKTISDVDLKLLNQNQLDAIISFVFNVGSGNWKLSKVRALLLEEKVDDAAYYFRSFVRAAGKPVLGLVRRRAVEKLHYQGNTNGYGLIFIQRTIDPYQILDIKKES